MSFCPQCSTQYVVDPPIRVYEDYFYPQVVQVIHPIEIIKRHHCVPVPHHIAAYSVKDEFCHTAGLKSDHMRHFAKR
jgi:hypothetical protein